MAFVKEEWQAEDVSVERPRSIQVFRIPDDPLEGEGHSIQLRHRERMRPLSPFRRGTPTCKGRLTIQKVTRQGVSKSTETSSSYRLLLAPVSVKTSPVERLPSPSESLSARVPFANVPRMPLARDTFVNTETPLLRVIGRLERVPFPAEPSACTKKRTSESAGAGPNPERTAILDVYVVPKVSPA